MKTIHNTQEFLAVIGPDGLVTEPVELAARRWLPRLWGLRSLDGVALAKGCWLYDLTGVTSLDGVALAPGCGLTGLSSLTSLAGVTMAERCGLYNYLPWGIRFYADRLCIGCEKFLPGVTDEYIRDVIARHEAAEHTDRIFEAVNLWRGWIA